MQNALDYLERSQHEVEQGILAGQKAVTLGKPNEVPSFSRYGAGYNLGAGLGRALAEPRRAMPATVEVRVD